jgi:protein TonB
MAYLHTSTLPTYDPRRSVGLLFAVLLHTAVLIAIINGLHTPASDPPPTTHVTVIDRTVTPVVPQPVLPNVSLKNWTVETIQQPVIVEIPDVVNAPPIPPTVSDGAGETHSGGGKVAATAARVDPNHPLTQPAYPAQSRRLGEAGTVELMLYVLPNGRVGDARVVRSSGFPKLDEAALREARRSWRLLPNTENGVAVAAWNNIAITFRLTR